jgi:hypothetical protein
MAKKIPIDEEALKRQMLSGKSVLVPAAPAEQNLSENAGAAEKDAATTPSAEAVAVRGQEHEGGDDDDALLKAMATPAKKQAAAADGDKDLIRYEKLFLSRSIVGLPRTNVGISLLTLEKAEKVVHRVFDGQIAVSTFIDNIITEHIARHEKSMSRWLLEKSVNLFG